MSEPRVVVVGGGLAGLAAALSCADGGARVTLLEARPRLGGATFSFQREGLSVDNGQHVFLRCCVAYLRFLDRVGARDRTVLQDRMAIPVLSPGGGTQWLRRSALPAPLHLAGSLSRYGFLRPAERARADQASLALAVKVFRTGLLEHRDSADIGYARVPLSEVHAEPAARALAEAGAEIRLRAAVRRIRPAGSGLEAGGKGFEVETEVDRVEADAVVVAVPHDRTAEVLPAGAVPDGAAIASLGSSPIVNVHVVYDRRVMDLPFAAGLGTPVQWVFDRTEHSGLDRGQYRSEEHTSELQSRGHL